MPPPSKNIFEENAAELAYSASVRLGGRSPFFCKSKLTSSDSFSC